MVTIPIHFCYNEYFLLQNVFWYSEFTYYAIFYQQVQEGNYNLV